MLTTKYVWKQQEADDQLELLREGFSEKGIDSIKAVAMSLAIKALCGDDYVKPATDSSIHSQAEGVSEEYNIPYPLVLKEAAKFRTLVVDEKQASGTTLLFCRLVKQVVNSQR